MNLPAEVKVRLQHELQMKAATILTLVGLAKSEQDPINCGHSAQHFYRPPLAEAELMILSNDFEHACICHAASSARGQLFEYDI